MKNQSFELNPNAVNLQPVVASQLERENSYFASHWLPQCLTSIGTLTPTSTSRSGRNVNNRKGLFLLKSNLLALSVALFLGLGAVQNASAGLVNNSFEAPDLTTMCGSSPCYRQLNQSSVPGWKTTAGDQLIEIWKGGYGGVFAFAGNQHAELNATQVGTLYQYVSGIQQGSIVGWQFAHRGRYGVDTMAFVLTDLGPDGIYGTSDDSILFNRQFSDGNTAWGFYSGGGIVATGDVVRFSFVSVSSYGNIPDAGNFLDDADFGVGVGTTPEPGTLALLGTGVLGLGGYLRRRLLG